MINTAKTKLYQKPELSMKAAQKLLWSPWLEKPTIEIGINMIAWAKIIGITLAAFTFKGIYWRAPPYCLFPMILFAYWTGTLRVPWTNKIAPAITNKRNNISIKNITRPPVFSLVREINSWNKECGSRAIIPIKMIKEMPFPIPLSVMRSPSHKMNILPAAKITAEEIVNQMPPGKEAPTALSCTLKFTK